ncbi:MAG: histidinol-phosphate transaminase [Candidatus Omnitrophota bacterium]
MKDMVRRNVLGVNNYVPGKPIEEVRRELGLKEVIKLASNENCLGPSPKAMAAIRRSITDINRYPESSSYYLRERTARALGVDRKSLIFGNGSDEIICLSARAFVEEGDEVIISDPTFLIYEIASQLHGAKIKRVASRGDLRYDLGAMKAAITDRTKMVFIANPDNPTGTYVTKKELDRFFDGLPRKTVVFLDEAYFEFARSAFRDYPDGIHYLNRPGVIVARSFSKAYGLAGLRIGYGVSSPEIIGYMERVREPFNVNLLAQAGAAAAIGDKAFLRKTLSHVGREKGFLYAALSRMGLRYVESATNFMLVDVGKDCKEVFNALLKKGVIVRDMKAWGMDNYIRVTIGTRAENEKFVKALKGVLKTGNE